MTKAVADRFSLRLVIPVANVDAFPIGNGIAARKLSDGMGRAVLQPLRDGKWKPAGRIHPAEKDLCHGQAAFHSVVAAVYNGLRPVGKDLHVHRRTGRDCDDRILIGIQDSGDQFLLSVRKLHIRPVASLQIELVIQPDKQNGVFTGFCQGCGFPYEFSAAFLRRIASVSLIGRLIGPFLQALRLPVFLFRRLFTVALVAWSILYADRSAQLHL